MKKTYLLLLLLTGISQAQIVNIPDPAFKAKLLEANVSNGIAYGGGGYIKIDTSGDGEIQLAEAQAVDSLDVANSGISNLDGILGFTNLKKLNCNVNNLSALNVNALTGLRSLICSNNIISAFNVSGLANLKNLDCAYNGLSALDVSTLINLEELRCNDNGLTALDVTNLTSLTYLNCGNNVVTALNVVPLANLQYLDCNGNLLSSLDLTGKTNLDVLVCSDNADITELDVSDCTSLYILYCSNLQLSSLDLTGLSILNTLECEGNNLSSLTLTGCNNMYYMSCANNALTSLDFSGLQQLQAMDCSDNQITALDFSGNPAFVNLRCVGGVLAYLNLKNGFSFVAEVSNWSGNPLQFVCCDEYEETSIQNILASSGLTGVNTNGYCNFVPGGDYNTITGTVIFDGNNNGCDAGDLPQQFIKMTIDDGETTGASFNDSSGTYEFYVDYGNYTVTPGCENATFFNFSPASAEVNFLVTDNLVSTNDFCITANGIHPDLEVAIVPNTPARPGFDAVYMITYRNKGNQTAIGTVYFDYDDSLTDLVSATVTPDSQSTGSLAWNYSGLMPFESRSIYVTLNVNSPIETPAVNAGDVLNFGASVTPVSGDDFPDDNQISYNNTVVNSCDPNDKYCAEGESVSSSEIGNYLHYLIRFENTGTATAVNVVVKDVIDETMFDVSTLQIMSSSHPVQARVNGNKAEFIFAGIDLAIGGHGNILLKIKTRDNLAIGSEVSNMAEIFFDYNFPIETNLARTSFDMFGVTDPDPNHSIAVYPNPAQGIINIKSAVNMTSVQLYDIQGRLLQTKIANETETAIDLSGQQNGVYFVKVTSENGTKIEKVVKQ